MRLRALAILVFALLATSAVFAQDRLVWQDLPALPDTPGYGGPFVGSHQSRLILAGGANFPEAAPWEGGQKVWYDHVLVLDPGATEWRDAGKLSAPLAYGAAISTDYGVALLGGSDAERHYATCQLLIIDQKTLRARFEGLPPLPTPTAFPAAAANGTTIYVAAGSDGSDATAMTHAFWSLDLAADTRVWKVLPAWPGPARHKAVGFMQSNGVNDCFYLFSGEIPQRAADGKLSYDYRTDGYSYDTKLGAWRQLNDLPTPVAAACSMPLGQSHALVFSGSTGTHVTDPDPKPEFPRLARSYHTITDTWTDAGSMPTGLVTAGAVMHNGEIVIATGEVSPGVRTPAVRIVSTANQDAGFGVVNTIVLALYLLALVWIGVRFSKRGGDSNDFFLAGRRIPWWAAGISIFATQLSAITFVSTPALAYASDWLVLPGKAMILLMAPIVVLLYLPFFRRLNITTAYEYLERRFSLSVRLFGSASFIAFQLLRMAIVVFLPALALSTITGIDVYACILIMGVLSTLYTVLGGMEAVIWTDVLQTFVLIGGMLVAIVIVAMDVGGFGVVFETANAANKTRMWDWSMSTTDLATWSILLGTLALQFGPYTTDQSVVQRYLSTKDERSAARGIWLNGLMAVPVGLLFMLLGTCLYVFFQHRPELLHLGMKNDEVFPLFVSSQLPAGLSGLVIAGVFAASMSSLDSSMHSIATACTVDWHQRLSPNATDSSSLRLARRLTVVLGVIAVVTASLLVTFDIQSLWFFFQKCLGLLSSGLVGIFALGIFTKRASSRGVLLGACTSIAVLAYMTWFSSLHFYLYAVIGITTCLVVGYLASLAMPDDERDLTGLTRNA
ncbi:MAG: SSS family solute:Na+ symporter [Planctomycetota bacterium]|jgi:SSS family solute:Na+ symporter